MSATTHTPTQSLSHSRAAALLQVVDLEAHWANLQPDRPASSPNLLKLNEKQRAYETFRSRLSAYQSRFGVTYEPEPLLSNLVRLATWCTAMRSLCVEAAAEGASACPTNLLAKAFRAAERAGAKFGEAPPRSETPPQTVLHAADELEALARWYDSLAAISARPVKIPA